jgi:hypothetical protein
VRSSSVVVLPGESCREVSDSGKGRNGEEFGAGDGDDIWPVEPSEAAADVLAGPACLGASSRRSLR